MQAEERTVIRSDSSSQPPTGSPSVHLDALRGFAALSVLLYHWRFAFFAIPDHLHQRPLLRAAYFVCGLGQEWVIVFFVLSGYLVGGSVLRSVAGGRWSQRSYALARVTRLYVVLLPALLLGGVLDWVGMHLAGTGDIYNGNTGLTSISRDVHTSLTLPTLVANSLFLQTIKLPGLGGYSASVFGTNGPLWSLSNEFWYYLAFPLLVVLVAKGRTHWVRGACGLGLLVWVWFVGSGIALLGITWMMGVLVAILPPVPVLGPLARGVAILGAFALFGAAFALLYHQGGSFTNNLVLGSAVTLLIWVTVHCATSPLPLWYSSVAQRSARSSYTLYLTHFPLLVFLKASLHLPCAIPSWHALLVGAGILGVVVLYSQAIYELCEKHTDAVRNWIKPYVLRAKAT